MRVWGVVPAAGIGRRMGEGDPKQYREAAGAPILVHTLKALTASKVVDGIIIAVAENYIGHAQGLVADFFGADAPIRCVVGGATRQESVYRALLSLAEARVDIVIIHDAARPLVTDETIHATLAAAEAQGAAVAAIPAAEASCLAESGLVTEYIDRRRHVTIQTPQAFRYELIVKAHEQAIVTGITDAVDDGLLVFRLGEPVAVSDGRPENIKVTYEGDIMKLEKMVKYGN